MKVFLTIVNGIMAVGVVDPNIVNGNGPGGNECPNNSCYEIDEIGVCNVKESCFRITCTKLGTGIQFKGDLLFQNYKNYRESDAKDVLFIQGENGWEKGCGNGTFSKLPKNHQFDLQFHAPTENSCFLLRKAGKSREIEAVYSIAGTNIFPNAGLVVGKQIKYSFTCPLISDGEVVDRPAYEDRTDKTQKKKESFIGSYLSYALLIVIFIAIQLAIKKKHQTELRFVKGKGF